MTETPPLAPPEATSGRRERAWPWLVALASGGVLLSTLPHLIQLAGSGDSTYLPDGDGLLYLAWSRDMVRHGSLGMTDAVHRPSGPMMHPWILFGPAALAAHAMGIGAAGLGIVWRAMTGIGLALGLYWVVRPFTRTARGAAGLAAFLLFDAGFLFGQIVQRDAEILLSLARRATTHVNSVPRIMAHLRVPTPSLAIPVLLAHIALAHRARRRLTTASALAAGVSLGLLFHVYFYFATAAALGTVLAWLLDRDGRRAYALMLALGAAIALPAVVEGARIKGITPPDWLHRTDKFVRVGRFDRSRWLVPKLLILEWLAAGVVVFRSRRDLLYLWCCTGAGLALVNQQIVTGMELENFHWTFAYGVAFSLLLALLALPWLGQIKRWRWIAPGLLALQVAVGLGLRGVESVAAAETNQYRALLRRWRAEPLELPAGAVVAGPRNLLLMLGALEDIDPLDCRLVEFSSQATDLERDERLVLNVVLMGLGRADALAAIGVGDHVAEESMARRLRLLDELSADPGVSVARFGVTSILAPAGSHPPMLGGRARLVEPGLAWDLWRIDPPPIPPPAE